MGMTAMKPTVLAAACMLSAFTPALAQDLSPDAKRLLAYGTVAVVVKSCGLPITDAENKQMMDAMAKYAEQQKDISKDQFTEAMKAAGAQVGSNKEAVCGEASTTSISDMLAEAEKGE